MQGARLDSSLNERSNASVLDGRADFAMDRSNASHPHEGLAMQNQFRVNAQKAAQQAQ